MRAKEPIAVSRNPPLSPLFIVMRYLCMSPIVEQITGPILSKDRGAESGTYPRFCSRGCCALFEEKRESIHLPNPACHPLPRFIPKDFHSISSGQNRFDLPKEPFTHFNGIASGISILGHCPIRDFIIQKSRWNFMEFDQISALTVRI